ncbi:hypothetical protein [Sorangium sp. So ce145]
MVSSDGATCSRDPVRSKKQTAWLTSLLQQRTSGSGRILDLAEPSAG